MCIRDRPERDRCQAAVFARRGGGLGTAGTCRRVSRPAENDRAQPATRRGNCQVLPQPRHGTAPVSYTHLDVYKRQSPAIKDGYIVKKGDTLYSIALDHGLDYRDLVAWNTIENPNRILVGQALRCLLYTSRCV